MSFELQELCHVITAEKEYCTEDHIRTTEVLPVDDGKKELRKHNEYSGQIFRE